MVIIDLTNKKVNQHSTDPGTVILRGASAELIQNLSKLTLGTAGYKSPAQHKVGLAGSPATQHVSTCIPESVHAAGTGDYDAVYQTLSALIDSVKPSTNSTLRTNRVLKTAQKSRVDLQAQIAKIVTTNGVFISELRTEVQNSAALNPHENLPTVRNIQAAAALYAYFSDDTSFSSPNGAATIAKEVQVSSDLILRLGTDFNILRRVGASSGSRYFVSKTFANAFIRVLQRPKFAPVLAIVDGLQDDLDILGSLKQ